MSADRPPFVERWLRLLGLALIAEALLSFAPWLADVALRMPGGHLTAYYLGHAVFPGLLGAVTLAMCRGSKRATVLQAAALIGVAAIVFCLVGRNLLEGGRRVFGVFEVVSMMLTAAAAPALWGSALARLEIPGSEPLRSFGRKSAGLIQLAFVFRFVARTHLWGTLGSLGSGSDLTFVVWNLTEILESLVLLWASIESVRTTPDEEAVRRRAFRIHRLMKIWVVLIPLGFLAQSLIQILANFTALGDQAYYLWTMSILLTSTLIATLAVARSCGSRAPDLQFPTSDPPPERITA